MQELICVLTFFFFNDTATTEIYTLSLHDALPIYAALSWLRALRIAFLSVAASRSERACFAAFTSDSALATCSATFFLSEATDRKSTRLNSSHANISYAVFCLKKKKILITRLLYRC